MRRFTRVHPSGLSLARRPRVERERFGFYPGLRTPQLPTTHARAGTVQWTLDRITTSPATSKRRDHSSHATSRRTAVPSFGNLLRQAAGEVLPPPLGSTAPRGAPGDRSTHRRTSVTSCAGSGSGRRPGEPGCAGTTPWRRASMACLKMSWCTGPRMRLVLSLGTTLRAMSSCSTIVKRLHSTLGYRTPFEAYSEHMSTLTLAA